MQVTSQCGEFVWTTNQSPAPVQVALYYECLCMECKEIIQRQLFPTWKAVGSIMNLTLLPYGNAMVSHISPNACIILTVL